MSASSSPPSPALRLLGVEVRYAARTALRGVDLEVPAGEFLALAGPNGSGKSTLLRLVLGLELPHRGDVELFGGPVSALTVRERALRVAWVPQEEALREDVPVEDYVRYGRYPFHGRLDRETEADREIARAALAEVGLADRSRDGVLSISGGERQRAILARALAQSAPLLLLDEPTAHLDIGHQLDILSRVRTLVRTKGVTVVAALHDLNLAARFADRIVVLSHGRIVADGPPASVLSEALLARVWGVAAERRRDPSTGIPYLVPLRSLPDPPVGSPTAGLGPVHVVGGGGAATPYLRALTEAGFEVTAGVLHLLDSDLETAESLGIAVAVEVPFAPLGEEARENNRRLLESARAVVVTPFAVGPSNLSNLTDVVPYVARLPVFLAGTPAIATRDFSGGEAVRTFDELVARGAKVVEGAESIVEELRGILSVRPARTSDSSGRAAASRAEG